MEAPPRYNGPSNSVGLPVGRTPRKTAKFDDFRTRKFVPHLFTGIRQAISGCGATALGVLTGEDPAKIPKPPRQNWTSKYMVEFLRARRFKVQKLTCRNVTDFQCVQYPIHDDHVILASVYLVRGMTTWIVIHKGIKYHNFEVEVFRDYELINHPLRAAYLLIHPRWRRI